MKQAWINIAGAEVAVIEAAPPQPNADKILVRMRSAALNYADLLMVDGQYQDTPPFPFVPGLEGAGEVVAAPAHTGFSAGDRVLYSGHGALAQQILADPLDLTPLPDSLGWNEAAGFQIAYGTSHMALTTIAGLQPDEILVVLGASGGVGQTAVELGAALGAKVVGLARGADQAEAARLAGATIALDISQAGPQDLRDTIRAAIRKLGGEGADVVYDPVGDAPGLAAFGALRRGGRFLLVGFAAGRPPALPLNHALVKNISIHGFYWGGWRNLDPQAMQSALQEVANLAARGLIRPRAGLVMPLAEVSQAYEALRSRRQIGKVVITL